MIEKRYFTHLEGSSEKGESSPFIGRTIDRKNVCRIEELAPSNMIEASEEDALNDLIRSLESSFVNAGALPFLGDLGGFKISAKHFHNEALKKFLSSGEIPDIKIPDVRKEKPEIKRRLE